MDSKRRPFPIKDKFNVAIPNTNVLETLNEFSKQINDFDAVFSGGTSNQILKSNGPDSGPTWVSTQDLGIATDSNISEITSKIDTLESNIGQEINTNKVTVGNVVIDQHSVSTEDLYAGDISTNILGADDITTHNIHIEPNENNDGYIQFTLNRDEYKDVNRNGVDLLRFIGRDGDYVSMLHLHPQGAKEGSIDIGDTNLEMVLASSSDILWRNGSESRPLATKQYVESQINQKLSTVFKYKGSYVDFDALETTVTDPEIGDVYNIIETGKNVVWSGQEWDDLGGVVDLSDYPTFEEVKDIVGGSGGSGGSGINMFRSEGPIIFNPEDPEAQVQNFVYANYGIVPKVNDIVIDDETKNIYYIDEIHDNQDGYVRFTPRKLTSMRLDYIQPWEAGRKGQFLQSNGLGLRPEWVDPPTSGSSSSSSSWELVFNGDSTYVEVEDIKACNYLIILGSGEETTPIFTTSVDLRGRSDIFGGEDSQFYKSMDIDGITGLDMGLGNFYNSSNGDYEDKTTFELIEDASSTYVIKQIYRIMLPYARPSYIFGE